LFSHGPEPGRVLQGIRDGDGTGLEACTLTAWLQQGLSAEGIPAVCIEARQAKAAMGAMPNKTDRNDARGIAQIMRTAGFARCT
jgi:transposase